MDIDNPFDRFLRTHNIPEAMHGAAVDVTDTLEMAWNAAKAVFRDEAKPEHAIAVCRLFLEQHEREVVGRLPR